MGALKKFADSRWFPRYHVISSEFHGRLAFTAGNPERGIDAKVCDVSPDGLGVVLGTVVTPGQVFFLQFFDREIPVVVVYCIPDLVNQGRYRCGMQRRSSSSENLVRLFAEQGLLQDL